MIEEVFKLLRIYLSIISVFASKGSVMSVIVVIHSYVFQSTEYRTRIGLVPNFLVLQTFLFNIVLVVYPVYAAIAF